MILSLFLWQQARRFQLGKIKHTFICLKSKMYCEVIKGQEPDNLITRAVQWQCRHCGESVLLCCQSATDLTPPATVLISVHEAADWSCLRCLVCSQRPVNPNPNRGINPPSPRPMRLCSPAEPWCRNQIDFLRLINSQHLWHGASFRAFDFSQCKDSLLG